MNRLLLALFTLRRLIHTEGKMTTMRQKEELQSVKDIDNVMTWELSETIAAVIMEPIITGGGILLPPQNYMKGVKETCENTVHF